MRELKVLHVAPHLAQGGAERVLHLVATSREQHLRHELMLMADDVFFDVGAIETTSLGFNFSQRLGSMARLAPAMRTLRRHVAQTAPDVVIGWLYYGAFLTLALARSGVPVVWSIHNTTLPGLTANPTLRGVDRVLAAASSRLPARIIYCAATARHVHEARGYAAGNGIVIRNGVDTAHFHADEAAGRQWRAAAALAPDAFAVTLCARYDAQKNVAGTLDAFAGVLGKVPSAVLMLAGRGMDAANRELAALIERRSLASACRLLGPLADPAPLLRASDAVVLASTYGEAMPMVLLEALAAGTPVVATRVGDIASLPVPREALAEPGDADGLATALLHARDTACWPIWQTAFETVRRDYALARTLEGYSAVLHAAAERHVRPSEVHP